MKPIVILALSIGCLLAPRACAADTAASPSAEAKLQAAEQQTRLARLEALVLTDQLERASHDKRQLQEQQLAAEACKAAGAADMSQCALDLSAKAPDGSFDLGRAVTKKPDVAPAAKAAAKP